VNSFLHIFTINLRTVLLTGFLFLLISENHAQKVEFDLKNQVSAWGVANKNNPYRFQLGGRYLPTVNMSIPIGKKGLLDTELSANTYGSLFFNGSEYDDANKDLKPYRMWVRYSTSRFEMRIGLQKINFGSASIFRPLMWFDKMDFRDPLQLTDGVYAVLWRYYFPENTNVWLWVLRGNDVIKGWEAAPSKKKLNEYGGRLQMPVFTGEVALSYHSRYADFSSFYPVIPPYEKTYFNEESIGVDGKMDIGPGIWFEYVHKRNQEENPFTTNSETYVNVGIDYTFGIGNGLNVTSEYFYFTNHPNDDQQRVKNKLAAIVFNYPFGLMNNVTAVAYYNIETKDWYRFVNLSREFDYWSFYCMLYWNPDKVIYGSSGNNSIFKGKGIQLMAVVNF